MQFGRVAIVVFCIALQIGLADIAPAEALKSMRESSSQVGKLPIEVANGLITANISKVPLAEVLTVIAHRSGVKIFSFAPADETISIEFKNLSLSEALPRMLRDLNAAYFYSKRTNEDTGKSVMFLSEVRILGVPGRQSHQVRVFDAAQKTKETPVANTVPSDDRRLHNPHVAELLKQLREGKDSQSRISAVEQLAKSSEPGALETLAGAFTDEADPTVRATIAAALGKSWDVAAIEPLARMLWHDTSAQVREAAAQALGQVWNDSAVPYLIDALSHDRDAMVREQVALALGETAGEEAVDALAHSLTHDPRWFVREAAAIALVKLGGNTAQNALLAAAAYDSDGWVKEMAAQPGTTAKP